MIPAFRNPLIFVTTVLGALPISVRSGLGDRLGRILAFFPSREKLITSLQLNALLRDAPNKPTVADVFGNLGRVLFETLNLAPLLDPENCCVEGPSEDEISKLLSESSSLVALTAHVSNWDLLAAYFISRGAPLTTIAREARNPLVQEVLETIRERYGIETVWRTSVFAVKALLRKLKEKRVIAALIDQDTTVSARFIPFFGLSTATPSGIVDIAQRGDAALVSAFLVRLAPLRYKVIIEPLPLSLPPDEILAEFNRRLEIVIREYPDQWVWLHKRWRTLPSGEKLNFEEYCIFLQELAKSPSLKCRPNP